MVRSERDGEGRTRTRTLPFRSVTMEARKERVCESYKWSPSWTPASAQEDAGPHGQRPGPPHTTRTQLVIPALGQVPVITALCFPTPCLSLENAGVTSITKLGLKTVFRVGRWVGAGRTGEKAPSVAKGAVPTGLGVILDTCPPLGLTRGLSPHADILRGPRTQGVTSHGQG